MKPQTSENNFSEYYNEKNNTLNIYSEIKKFNKNKVYEQDISTP